MKNMIIKYPNKLREHRIKSNLTQKQVAALLGMQCEDRLSHWEQGQSMPSVINLIKICEVYQVNILDVYGHIK